MKKTIIALAAVALLASGSVMAQRGYNQYPNQAPGGYNQYPNQAPGSYNQYPNQAYNDEAQDWYRIERLDEIVGLSRHQKREIKRIEDRYDRLGLTPGGRLYPQDAQRLRFQKQQDIISVLNPIQRDRFFAFQQGRRSNRGGGYYGRRG